MKANIKSGKIFIDGEYQQRDIFIQDGIIKDIKPEIRANVFSGVYEFDAQRHFIVPFFVDCGCFALGSRIKGEEIPVISLREYKKLGFYSFITSINVKDKKERLITQEKQINEYIKDEMHVKYLTGGMKDLAYHVNKDIYTDISFSKNCVGASVVYNDLIGGIEQDALLDLCLEVEAVSFDYKRSAYVYLFIGDQTIDCQLLLDSIKNNKGREKTIVLWFANRSNRILNSCIDYLDYGGIINLIANGKQEKNDEDTLSLSDSLINIYEKRKSLDHVIASSFHGGLLPNTNEKGSISNLYYGVKKAVESGLPVKEALKVLTHNPISIFNSFEQGTMKNKRAKFLIIDEQLNIIRIVDGEDIKNPINNNDLILFI